MKHDEAETVDESGIGIQGADKLAQVFTFLREFSSLQNPVVRNLSEYPFSFHLSDAPIHPFISIPIRQGTSETDDFVIKVKRPELTSPPRIDEILQDWVVASQDPDKRPVCRDALNRPSDDGTITEKFSDNEERVSAWANWLASWERWAVAERPNRIADRFFQKIYGIRALLERESESYELVLGDGNLVCAEVAIDHPIVSQRVILDFDPHIPEFTVRVADAESELNMALLWELPEKNSEEIVACKKELAEQGLSPADPAGIKPYFNRAKMVVSYGEFFESHPLGERRCFIYTSPAIFLRRRSGGFNEAIQKIIGAIPKMPELPPALVQICGIVNPLLSLDTESSGESETHYGNEREDILFTKPANREQVQIVDRLNRHGTVIVQGPPGTGKSYTIGNIIGHLLAQGKRILVTAHTTKALQVVRDQVVDELRSLCVAVLGDDAAGQSELEKAVTSILEHLNEDPKQLRREAAPLVEKRKALLREIKVARGKSLLARSQEYREISFGGEGISPSQAARAIKDGMLKHDWIPGLVFESDAPPMEISEIIRLYGTNSEISVDEEWELRLNNPSLKDLPTPARFVELVTLLNESDTNDKVTGREFWTVAPRAADAESLNEASLLCNAAPQLLDSESWRFAVVAESMSSPDLRKKWEDTAKAIRKVEAEAHEFSRIAAEHGPEMGSQTGITEAEQLGHLLEIEAHISEKGRISGLSLLLKPRWKLLLASCTVNGRKPTRAEEIAAISGMLKIRESRRLLILRWERTMAPLGAHSTEQLGTEPERILIHYASEIETLVDWNEKFLEPLKTHLLAAGFNWDAFLASIPPEYAANGHLWRLKTAICTILPPILAARINHYNHQVASEEMNAATASLREVSENDGASRVTRTLMSAVETRDFDAYGQAFEVLADLERKRPIQELRFALIEKIQSFAPDWSEAIRSRKDPHNEDVAPGNGDVKAAWRWRRLNQELEKRASETPDNIEKQIEEMAARLFELTATIAGKLAWAHQLESLEGNQRARMALTGWQQTIQRLGRGTGRSAAARRQKAREEMRQAKEAVPVWVMPLKKVLENFDPVETRFDAIIIDEASQCDVLGLVPLFMAKTIIVVGDHEQVSPDAVGMKQDDIDRIVASFLHGIPQSHLYDGKASIYQFAQRAFSGTIMLREHFRCDSKIISFSNRLCYGGKIVPLRDTSRVLTQPALVPFKVEGFNIGKTNESEALTTAALIMACLERKEYQHHPDGKSVTFGVISLRGTEQADRIRAILTQRLDLALIDRHRIICGNPAQFQGDERDVVFLSMVDSPAGGGPIRLRQEDRFKKRFNVAASRARNQAWLVYSLDPQVDLQQADLRRRLIEHVLDPNALEEQIVDAERQAESEFERRVLRRLVGESYLVHPQWKVGKYRIDMVIEGERHRLALELDGDRYHPPEKLVEDMERQAMLERAGWRFVRIRGSQFFRDEDKALQPLYEKLEQMEIRPRSDAGSNQPSEAEAITLIRERASCILAEWNNGNLTGQLPRQEHTPPHHVTEFQRTNESAPEISQPDVHEVNQPEPSQAVLFDEKSPLKRPFTFERLVAYTGRPLGEIQRIAWHACHWAGDSNESIPLRAAQAIAVALDINLAE